MNNIDVLKQLKNLENLELTANNVKMSDGSSVESVIISSKEDILSLQNELGANKESLIDIVNKIIDL